MRDLRTLNMVEGQKIESDETLKKIGDLAYRNLGTLTKMSLFDSGKALVVGSGLRVEPSSGMTVNIPSGVVFQKSGVDVFPCIQVEDQTVTIDAASGVPRVDIIEAQIKNIEDKNDYSQIATVSGSSVSITVDSIKRDIKYYLSCRKQTDTTDTTEATAGTLTGTVSIPGTIDLSENYLVNISDGEDGSYQEIDCRGTTPEATTKTEIVNNINAAVGRTMASISGNFIVLTGNGTGIQSQFSVKPPVTDPDKDAMGIIFGVSVGGAYKYNYKGVNAWFKLAEIDVGASTTTITSGLIRNINEKSTWASEGDDIFLDDVKSPSNNFIEFDTTGSVDLFDYQKDVILYCSPSSDITITVSNYLPKGKILSIIKTTNKTLTLNINSINYSIIKENKTEFISDDTKMTLINKSSEAIEIIEDNNFFGIVQSVNGSKIDSNGLPDFLTESSGVIGIDTDSGTNPFYANVGNGRSIYGRRTKKISISSDVASAWDLSSVSDDTYYLFIDIDSGGSITYVFFNSQPDYSKIKPGSPSSGQLHYNISENKVYVYNGSTWEQKTRICVGQCVVSGTGTVFTLTNYALNGDFVGYGSITAAGTSAVFNHNIGVNQEQINSSIDLQCINIAGSNGYSYLDIVTSWANFESGQFQSKDNGVLNRTTCTRIFRNQNNFYPSTILSSVSVFPVASSFRMVCFCKRKF